MESNIQSQMEKVNIKDKISFKKVKIPVSSIAPLLGLDHYNNFPKIVCELWRKYNRDEFNQLEKELQKKNIDIATDSEARRLVRADIKNGTNFYQQVKKINSKVDNSQNLQVEQKKVIEQINKVQGIDSKKKEDMIKQVVSTTNKTHGINNENNVLSKYEAESGLKITSGQENMVYKFSQDENIGIDWIIHGKYDGFTSCGKLIEAKKRQKGLFKKLRDYEKVQIQTYMYMKGVNKGSLVESYSSKNNMTIHIIDVDYEEEYMQEFVISRLKKFTIFFKDFINNQEWRNELLMGDKKREIYNMYLKIYLNVVS